jgi:co-chaperonin GroES (HSP10)
MQPKLIRTPLAQFMPAEWTGKNESGIEAFGDYILVLPDPCASNVGGIDIPDDLQERMTEASETGIIVDMGEMAYVWNADRTRRFEGKRPNVGDHIIFARYSGAYHCGMDGRRYRMMEDKCMSGRFATGMVPVREKPKLKAPTVHKVNTPPLVMARGA